MKKGLFSYLNFFELNLSARSYKSAFIRILVSLLIMFIVCVIRFNVTLSNPAVNIIVTLLMLAIMICCILCFFIAAVECLQVGDNRKKDKARHDMEK